MEVTFYSFTKKKNSTAVPSNGTTIDVVLKERTSILNPTFVVKNNNALNWNYCFFNGRYYFLSNVTSRTSNIWEMSFTVDVLATYKNEIVNSECYTLRASNGNKFIVDTLSVPIEMSTVETLSTEAMFDYAGTFILGVANFQAPLTGQGITLYQVSTSQIRSILHEMYKTSWQETKLSEALLRDILDPWQFICSLSWCAGAYTNTTPALIAVGYTTTEVTGKPFLDNSITFNKTLKTNSDFTSFRDFEPYSEYYFNAGIGGKVQVPAKVLEKNKDISINGEIDINTCTATFDVFCGDYEIGVFQIPCGGQIPLAKSNSPGVLGAITSAIGAGLSVIGNNVTGAIQNSINAMGSIAGGSTVSVRGGTNTTSYPQGAFTFTVEKLKHEVSENSENHANIYGVPSCKIKRISDCGHFVMTDNASINISGTEEEKENVNSMLNGGVYIE